MEKELGIFRFNVLKAVLVVACVLFFTLAFSAAKTTVAFAQVSEVSQESKLLPSWYAKEYFAAGGKCALVRTSFSEPKGDVVKIGESYNVRLTLQNQSKSETLNSFIFYVNWDNKNNNTQFLSLSSYTISSGFTVNTANQFYEISSGRIVLPCDNVAFKPGDSVTFDITFKAVSEGYIKPMYVDVEAFGDRLKDSNGEDYASWTYNGKTSLACMNYKKTDAIEMHRLYNPNSGEHFYTRDTNEVRSLTRLGWRDEGIGWYAPVLSNTPVYRFYNSVAGDTHVYTTDEAEYSSLLYEPGWVYEGICWYSDDSKSVALMRQYNPNAKTGFHNFTTSIVEKNNALLAGWKDEGIGWYGLKK